MWCNIILTTIWCTPCSEVRPGFVVRRSSWGQLLGKEGCGENWRAQRGWGVSCWASLCSSHIFSSADALTQTSPHTELNRDLDHGHPWLWCAKADRDLSLGCANRQHKDCQYCHGGHKTSSYLGSAAACHHCPVGKRWAGIRLSQSFHALTQDIGGSLNQLSCAPGHRCCFISLKCCGSYVKAAPPGKSLLHNATLPWCWAVRQCKCGSCRAALARDFSRAY